MEKVLAKKILIIDDDEDILFLLKYNLEKEGFLIKTCSNSSKMFQIADKYSPDLIILDVMMPEINGFDLCKKIRSIDKFKDTYIFFLSARSEKALHEEAYSLGANDYIDKMNGIITLKSKIKDVLLKN